MSNSPARAPMRGDSYKRFSIYKSEKKRSVWEYLFDWIVKGVLLGVLVSTNFVLFSSSSSYSLFAEGFYVIPHIILPIVVIFSLSLGIMFLISFSSFLENLLVSFIVGVFTYATINQFMMLSPDSFLYSMFYNIISKEFAMNFVSNSDVIVAFLGGILTMVLLLIVSKRTVGILTCILSIIFISIIADEYINQRNKTEFMTLYDEAKDEISDPSGNKFVYIMLPNATSYGYLSEMEKDKIALDDVLKTKDIMLGFFNKNNFTLYANSYVEDDDKFLNIVNQFNILSKKKGEDVVLDNVMIDGYMKFKNNNEKRVHLEENKLFDNFKNAHYKINAYQSHGIELCSSNNQVIVDKCVEKQSRPFSFNNMDISETQKTKLLLLQWADSSKLFKNLSWLYSFVNIFTDANKVALVGIPYNNLYVINSIKTFDIMYEDMVNAVGNNTYFAMIDLPNEMYVYDEFCNIKPREEWLNKENLPWLKNPNLNNRKKAYLSQTNCVYGKLQEFMDRLRKTGLDKNTVVVIQGISGANNNNKSEDFLTSIGSKRAVTMGIYEPRDKKFKIDYNICPTGSFLIKYLYGKNICKTYDEFKLGDVVRAEIISKILSNKIESAEVEKSRENFLDWYKVWAEKNGAPATIIDEPAEATLIKVREAAPSQDASTAKIQKDVKVVVPAVVSKPVVEKEMIDNLADDNIEIKLPDVKGMSTDNPVPMDSYEEVLVESVQQNVSASELEVDSIYEEENFFIEDTKETDGNDISTPQVEMIDIKVDDSELLSINIDDLL